jgi:hypothetical protein
VVVVVVVVKVEVEVEVEADFNSDLPFVPRSSGSTENLKI